MKKIFRLHPLTYIITLIAVLTANFKIYLIFMLLLLIHESGHLLAGYFFHWNLKQIVILPFGMISKYDNYLNIPLYEEIVVASMGITVQLLFYIFFFRDNYYFYWCNLIIIVFNLLPIYPLDGSKIVNVILNKIFSFRSSYLTTMYISLLFVILLLAIGLIKRDLVVIIILIPLFINLLKEYLVISSTVNKFYLERFLYHFEFDNLKYIEGVNIHKMKRDNYHYFKVKDKVFNEDKILRNLFDKQ